MVRSELTKYLKVLRHRPFATFWASLWFSSFGGILQAIAITVFVYETTGLGAAVGALFVIRYLPYLVVSPIAGVVIDRIDRRLLIAGCDAVRAILILAYIFSNNLPILFAVTFISMCSMAIIKPARYALLPNLVDNEHLVTANALVMAAFSVVELLGSAAAGLLVLLWGRNIFFLASGLILIASLIMYFVPISSSIKGSSSEAEPPIWISLARGWSFIVHNRLLFALAIVTTLLWVALGSVESLLIIYTNVALHSGPAAYGYLTSIGGAGGLIGVLLTPILCRHRNRSILVFNVCIIIACLLLSMMAPVSTLGLALLIYGAFSLAYNVSTTLDEVFEQEMTPNRLRGKVIASIGAMGTVGYLIGVSLGAPLTDFIDVRLVILGTAFVFALTAMLGFLLLRPSETTVPTTSLDSSIS